MALATASARTVPALDLAEHRGQRRKGRVDAAGDQFLCHRRRAAERHMHEVRAGLCLEQLHRKMRGRAVAGRAVVEPAGLGFGLLDELGDRARGQVVLDHQHMLEIGKAGDRGEVLGVVAGVLEQDVVGGVGLVGRQHQGVAVGLGFCHLARADRARPAADILHDRALPEGG
jgi:hypothetical protein